MCAEIVVYKMYSKTCVKTASQIKTKQRSYSMKVEIFAECAPLKTNLWSFLEWQFYTSFTVPSIHRVDNNIGL